jgi:prepilin-type N-terminal cleavage/methylation domain-containing protein
VLHSLRQRTSDEGGFTLIELLVVILIIGILAAIAIPALLSQKNKAYDSSAKTVAQTAQTAAETYSTENGGSYANMKIVSLEGIEPSLKAAATEAHLQSIGLTKPVAQAGAVGAPSAEEYTVTAEAANTKDLYSVSRLASGEVKHFCWSAKKECPGKVEATETW